MMLDAALAWLDAGCSVVRVAVDGTKAPDVGSWKRYQSERADATQLTEWFRDGHPGIGVVTGAVSGHLELFELEGRAVQEGVFARLAAELADIGQAELLNRITAGYLEQSPSTGLHFLYRVETGVDGNTKLAQRPARDDELNPQEQELLATKGKRATRPLIETRGEAGFVVVAPSHGPTHPTGLPWLQLSGGAGTIATITAAERDLLHAVARSFDEMPAAAPIPVRERASESFVHGGDLTPGEDFNLRGSWHDMLGDAGWTVAYQRGDSTYWCRPGKGLGVSAVTGGDIGDFFWSWTTSSELPSEEALSKWRVYAYLEHGGDFSAAAGELRRQGYGTDRALPARTGDGFDGIFGQVVHPKGGEAATPSELLVAANLGVSPDGQVAVSGKFAGRLFNRDALRDLPRPEPLIEDTLDLGTVAMLVGYWGSMKSFLALDWAACISTGRSWQGRKVLKPGSVLYVAAEGAHGINDRLESWESGGDAITSERFVVLGDTPNLGNRADVAELCALVAAGGFSVVVFDTFAKCITGMEENSSKDMGIAIKALYDIQEATAGGTVIAVHHTGKDRLTSRGSSSIEGGVDTVYLSEKVSEGVMKLSRTKRKDGPDHDEMELRLTPVAYTNSVVLERNSIAGDAGLERAMDELMAVYDGAFSETGCNRDKLLVASMLPEPHFYRIFNALLASGRLVDVGTQSRPLYSSGS